MIISVTDEDISAGRWGDCNFCPVAIAAQRAYGVDHILVNGLYMMDTKAERAFELPEEAQRFVYFFDGDRGVDAFSFEAPPIQEWETYPQEWYHG